MYMHFIEIASNGKESVMEVNGNSRNDCVMTYLTSPILNSHKPYNIECLQTGCIIAEYNDSYCVLTSEGDNKVYAKWLSKK